MADRDFVAEYDSFEEVLESYASHLSEEGIFLGQAGPGSPGSEMAFEVKIRNSFSVLRGEGEIVRATDDGVFLRLLYLDQPSLKLLPRIVEHYRRHGVPLLELPVAARDDVEDLTEASQMQESGAVEEPTVDDLFEGEAPRKAPPIGLTLDDLEAEFLSDQSPEDPEPKGEADIVAEPSAALIDVTETEPAIEKPADLGIAVEEKLDESRAEFESDVDDEFDGLLVDPQELIADGPADEAALGPDDIHLDALLDVEETGGQESDREEALSLDSGLPWLPDEPETKSRKELWLLVALILLGAVLGVVFYFFFFKPQSTTSSTAPEPAEFQAAVLPATVLVADTATVPTVDADPPESNLHAATVPDEAPAEPTLAAPSPRTHGPPAEPATGVDRITWALESGETVITFWGDGLFVEEQVDDFRVAGGAPREVVRIRGMRRPFAEQRIELDTDHVRQIRIGLHQETGGAALHFVADLVDGDVELSRTEAAGEQVRVYFSKAS